MPPKARRDPWVSVRRPEPPPRREPATGSPGWRARVDVRARAALCDPPLRVGARVLMEDDAQGGKIVECQVARYEGEAVAFYFPDGDRYCVADTVEQAAARARAAQDRRWAEEQYGRRVRIHSRTVGGAVDATVDNYAAGLVTLTYQTANGRWRDKDIPLMKLRSLLDTEGDGEDDDEAWPDLPGLAAEAADLEKTKQFL